MASIKNLKKDINYVLGDIIEECYLCEMVNPEIDKKKTEAIIDEAIESFDGFIERVNDKSVENRKAHFKAINKDLEATANNLIEKINKL
jgi:hypothetical protein